jgi:hypothetical protein
LKAILGEIVPSIALKIMAHTNPQKVEVKAVVKFNIIVSLLKETSLSKDIIVPSIPISGNRVVIETKT